MAEQRLYFRGHQGIVWQHRNPVTETKAEHDTSNGQTTRAEYDPWGLSYLRRYL